MKPAYIIAEIGQNHNGDMEIAKQLIDIAAAPIRDFFSGKTLQGVDAVKFTKRDLDEELTKEFCDRPYISAHSFGKTYLEHRKVLELSIEQHAELQRYAYSKGLDFIETLCSPGCLKLLDSVKVDAIKIASRDVTNIPLLKAVGKLPHRTIISSGMCTLEELQYAIEILSFRSKEIAIMHCVSEYPAQYKNINLHSITYLKKHFPGHEIGYSDHSIGIVMPVVAVSMGAAIIEKHITISHDMKGSDHASSAEPDGLWRVVRDIRNTEIAMGGETKKLIPDVLPTRQKLARSVALQMPLAKGTKLTEASLFMLSPGNGLSWDQSIQMIGKRAKKDMPANVLICQEDFE
jgi:sialic acid synthase